MSSDDNPRIERVPCNTCRHRTNHELLYAQNDDWIEDEPGGPVRLATGAKELFRCRGCDGLTLRTWQDGATLGGRHETFYPPRAFRKKPEWLVFHGNEEVKGLLDEVYTALHADQRRLAMMGCRALVDLVLVQAVGDENERFNAKLDQMVKKGLLSQSHRQVLLAAIDAGSASVHRGYLPTPETLDHVVSIVEHLIQADHLATAADEVRKHTPPRTRDG